MVTEQDLLISRSLLILTGSFLFFCAVGVFHPKDKARFSRVRIAENYELPRMKSF
jgi:hypothetical protein